MYLFVEIINHMKKINQRIFLISILISLFFVGNVMGQDEKPYEFKMLKSIKTTSVKAQSRTSTCWSFAMTSFMETEAIRKGKGMHNLSPMLRFTMHITTKQIGIYEPKDMMLEISLMEVL